LRIVPITDLPGIGLEKLTGIWNHCWQGYYYDMTFTVEKMQNWLRLASIDLEHSLLLESDDQAIGFALLAREGEQAWLAGTAIAPEARGRGLFALLVRAQLEAARALGVKELFLEVLAQNHARKVYEAVGFTKIRQLNIFRVTNEQWQQICSSGGAELRPRTESAVSEDHSYFRPVSLAEYLDRRSLRFKPSWQRSDAYLCRYANLEAWLWRGGTGGFLTTGEGNPLLLDAWCSGFKDGWQVLVAIMARMGQLFLNNQPEDWLSAILKYYQVQPKDVQFEMRCYLGL